MRVCVYVTACVVCDSIEPPPRHVGDEAVTTEYVHALTGATVELRCSDDTAASSPRHSGVRWRRDGVELATAELDSRFQLRSNDALDIVDVRLDDAGQYTCHDAFHDVQWKRFVVQVIGMTNCVNVISPRSTVIFASFANDENVFYSCVVAHHYWYATVHWHCG